MRVCLEQFLGKNHSWSLVGQNIARALVKAGHFVHLKSTNGYEYFPEDLKTCVVEKLEGEYDMQLSYTAMHNFHRYLSHGSKNRFGIWNYETTVLPAGFAKYYSFTDKFLPSSTFSKEVFARNKIPESHMVVVPHGINLNLENQRVWSLQTKKRIKILANIAQPHVRKNLPGLLEAYGKAFTKQDDVCLVAKVSIKDKVDKSFEVDFRQLLSEFRRRYPQAAEVEVISHFIPDIVELYNACDIVFSMTHAECFWLPGIESMATGKITIAPRYGGQLDFMNDENSLLVEGKIACAPRTMQYWSQSPYAEMFDPNIDDAVSKLKLAVDKCEELKVKFAPGMQAMSEKFTWDKVAQQIVGLCER